MGLLEQVYCTGSPNATADSIEFDNCMVRLQDKRKAERSKKVWFWILLALGLFFISFICKHIYHCPKIRKFVLMRFYNGLYHFCMVGFSFRHSVLFPSTKCQERCITWKKIHQIATHSSNIEWKCWSIAVSMMNKTKNKMEIDFVTKTWPHSSVYKYLSVP